MSDLNVSVCDAGKNICVSLGASPSTAKRAREEGTETPVDVAAHGAKGERLSQQFALQGIEYNETDGTLFCAMCETSPKTARVSLEVSMEAILFHCSTRAHLTAYEKVHAEELKEWFPVELHGHRLLLDHHCIYPRTMFGPGRLLMDSTIAKGMLVAEDVCGGVSLLPLHKYTVTELVLTPSRAFTLPRDDEREEDNPAELATCAIEPLASLPSHIAADILNGKVPTPAGWQPVNSLRHTTTMPHHNGGTLEEAMGSTHLRFDKMLDSVNAAFTTELALQEEQRE